MFNIKIFKTETGKEPFKEWFSTLDVTNQKRILSRLIRIQDGNLGDHKQIDNELSELRFKYGGGFRIYYSIFEKTLIILLSGGDKSSQPKDIKKAKEYIKILKGNKNG